MRIINYIKSNLRGVLTVTVMIIGIVAGVFLANHPQILESRASGDAQPTLRRDEDKITTTAPTFNLDVSQVLNSQ